MGIDDLQVKEKPLAVQESDLQIEYYFLDRPFNCTLSPDELICPQIGGPCIMRAIKLCAYLSKLGDVRW